MVPASGRGTTVQLYALVFVRIDCVQFVRTFHAILSSIDHQNYLAACRWAHRLSRSSVAVSRRNNFGPAR